MAARIAVDLNLFVLLTSHDRPLSSAELSRLSGGEELLISRLLRLIAAKGLLSEEGPDLWAANPTTTAFAAPAMTAGARYMWEILVVPAAKAPKFIRENGHCCPSEPTDGFLQYASQTKFSVFDYMSSIPGMLQDFNMLMGNTQGNRESWYDWFPVEEQLLSGFDPNLPFLVDIGGGKGHDLQAFHRKYPGRGGLILQDLPRVLDGIAAGDLDPAIEPVPYDFFTTQSVLSARVYSFRHILHDWSDKYALQILAQVRKAMRPGYSKLLVHEPVLPDTNASVNQYAFDMVMVVFNSAFERSRKQWTALLEQAGFEVVKFWVNDADADGVVEAMVKE